MTKYEEDKLKLENKKLNLRVSALKYELEQSRVKQSDMCRKTMKIMRMLGYKDEEIIQLWKLVK